MRQIFLILFTVALILILPLKISAQKIKRLSLAVYNESVAFPATRIKPLHPGFEFGLTIREKEKAKSVSQINTYLGYYYHQNISNAFYLKGEYLFGLTFLSHLRLDLMTGIGYMHTFYPGDVYGLDNAGAFIKINQSGRPHLIVNAGLGLSYVSSSPIEPFIRYHFMLEAPFANGIPVFPHTILSIGLNYKFN